MGFWDVILHPRRSSRRGNVRRSALCDNFFEGVGSRYGWRIVNHCCHFGPVSEPPTIWLEVAARPRVRVIRYCLEVGVACLQVTVNLLAVGQSSAFGDCTTGVDVPDANGLSPAKLPPAAFCSIAIRLSCPISPGPIRPKGGNSSAPPG